MSAPDLAVTDVGLRDRAGRPGPDRRPVRRALRGTVFANPGAGQAPTYQGRVGLQDGPTMINDYLQFSLSPNTSSATILASDPTFDGQSECCWTASGLRGIIASWSTQDRDVQGC